ncbi:MAG TPA: tetratricopeptide repeat protein [Chryseolinea sp.]|nr:tetratricopeptide repeat protein [Chryseolinea sp.]
MKAICFIVLAATCFQLFAQQQPTEIQFPQDVDKLIHSYQFNKAIKLLEGREDSLSVEVLQRKGTCYHQMGNYNEAITEYEKLVSLDSMHQGALLALGQMYGKQKQFASAFLCYTKLIGMDSLNSYYYKQYGIVAHQANVVGAAIHYLDKALELNPTDIESNALLAEILINGEQPEVADMVLTKALKLTSSPQLSLLLAKAQLAENRYGDAIKTTSQLLVQGDTLPAHARIMGIANFALDEYEEAINWMNFLLNADTRAEWIYYYIGLSYQNINQPDSAIVYLNKAIDEGISENIGDYYAQLAASYEAANNFKMAIKYYKAGYNVSKSGILLYHLARNYDVFYKDKEQAILYFKKYLESDDTIKLAREYSRARVNQLEFYR